MKSIEAVIFDWAGTTVDYGCMAPIQAMNDAFSHVNLDVSLDDIRKPMGMLKIDHIKALLELDHVKHQFKSLQTRDYTSADVEKIYQHFENSIFKMLVNHSRVIDGVLPVQEQLRQRHIKIGSTSGYTQEMLSIVAENARKQGYTPDMSIASDQVKKGRPYPYMIHHTLNELDIQDVRRVIKVGDTVVDIQEGLNAGCWSIGVVKGSSMLGLSESEVSALTAQELEKRVAKIRHEMLNAGADYVIETMAELPDVIDQIQRRN